MEPGDRMKVLMLYLLFLMLELPQLEAKINFFKYLSFISNMKIIMKTHTVSCTTCYTLENIHNNLY
jgi:hypothetical protein